MTDGAGSLLRPKQLLPIPTRFVLDYFHVAMKIRHVDLCIGRIPPHPLPSSGSVFELYDRLNYLRVSLEWPSRRIQEIIRSYAMAARPRLRGNARLRDICQHGIRTSVRP